MEALKTDHLLLKLILRLNRIRLSSHLLGRFDFDMSFKKENVELIFSITVYPQF